MTSISLKEQLVPLRRVPQELESRGGKRPHVSAVHRWRQNGLKGVRLEAIQVGGAWHTSIEALDRWFKAVTEVGGQR